MRTRELGKEFIAPGPFFEAMLLLVSAVAATCLGGSARAQSLMFSPIGDFSGGPFESSGTAVASDGGLIVGFGSTEAGYQAYSWTGAGGMLGLGYLPGGNFSAANGVNASGSVVVGYSHNGTSAEAFHWTSGGGMVGLGYLPAYASSYAHASDASGDVVVGYSTPSGPDANEQAFRWTAASGMVGLGASGTYDGDQFSMAYSVSGDGSSVVGYTSVDGGQEGFLWSPGGGMVPLGVLGIYTDGAGNHVHESGARAISTDASTVVGYSYDTGGSYAFRWTKEGGMVSLGDLPGGGDNSVAYGVSRDGSTIVGAGETANHTSEAFIWDAANGMRSLKSLLIADGVKNLNGWTLVSANSISSDGSVITGTAVDPNGHLQAYAIGPVPEPSVSALVALGGFGLGLCFCWEVRHKRGASRTPE